MEGYDCPETSLDTSLRQFVHIVENVIELDLDLYYNIMMSH